MPDIAQIQSQITAICEKRKANLPALEAELKEVASKTEPIAGVLTSIDELLSYEQNAELSGLAAELKAASRELNNHKQTLENLRNRFARDTVNIGVSGKMGVGKSTALQKISGLTDEQIPTGIGLAVTAVRSKVFNSNRNEAEITFRSEASFIEGFVNPHLLEISRSRVNSLSQFTTLKLPPSIDNPTSVQSDSLNRLKDAQKSVASFTVLLTGEKKTIKLSEIEQYVSYPKDSNSIDRKYLAVDDVQIYCEFPTLPNIRLGLIDLPGLGEIADSVAKMHTAGLENDVDHVLMIIQPDKTRGQYDMNMGRNIDQLCAVQKGVRKRGNLITAAINHRDDATELEATLRGDFNKNVNETRRDDEIELLSFCALDETQVKGLFGHLLGKLAGTLAAMDVEILEFTKRQKGSVANITAIAQNIYDCAQRILSEIPLEEEQRFELITRIAKDLRHEYQEYESKMKYLATQESDWSKEFKLHVETIHRDCEQNISSGYFLGSKREWVRSIKGVSGDYINCYRQEAERIRRELISTYDRLNEYYTAHLDEFKNTIINIFLQQTGEFKELIITDVLTINEVISKLIAELSGTVRDNDFIDAFRLLLNMNFQFRQNVFYNLASCLERLSNAPVEIYSQAQKEHIPPYLVLDMRKLGDIGVPFSRVEPLMDKGLGYLATEANDSIKNALLNYDDKFNQYVFICAQFFNDYLFRKDEDTFKNVNIRCFVDSYKNYIVDTNEQQIDQNKERLLSQILDSIRSMNLRLDFSDSTAGASIGKSSPFKLSEYKVPARLDANNDSGTKESNLMLQSDDPKSVSKNKDVEKAVSKNKPVKAVADRPFTEKSNSSTIKKLPTTTPIASTVSADNAASMPPVKKQQDGAFHSGVKFR